jgi:hypothetical protein
LVSRLRSARVDSSWLPMSVEPRVAPDQVPASGVSAARRTAGCLLPRRRPKLGADFVLTARRALGGLGPKNRGPSRKRAAQISKICHYRQLRSLTIHGMLNSIYKFMVWAAIKAPSRTIITV